MNTLIFPHLQYLNVDIVYSAGGFGKAKKVALLTPK